MGDDTDVLYDQNEELKIIDDGRRGIGEILNFGRKSDARYIFEMMTYVSEPLSTSIAI